jgi:protein-S-isoprenylcysteine O-methyltransferase Ste14
MNFKKNFRIPLGFFMGIIFLFRAEPSLNSFFLGTVILLLGESIRFVSAGTLKKYKGVVSKNGIYSFTRNPLYIGSFFIGTGSCIIGRDPIFAVLFVTLFLGVYFKVIKREEEFLLKHYGEEYETYRKTVPMIFPRRIDIPYIIAETDISKSFNNREGKTIVGIVLILLAMIVKLIIT